MIPQQTAVAPFRLGRPFALLWLATGTSTFGTAVTDIALPLIAVLTFGASPLVVAALVAVEQVPWLLLGLVAGVWVDRWPHRTVLLVCDAGRAVLIASIPAAAALDVLTLGHLFVVAACAGSLSVFFTVAHMAVLPSIVPRDALVPANGRLSSTTTGADLGGRSAGGLLAQVLGAPGALVVDAVTFVVSGLCVRRLPAAEKNNDPGPSRSFRGEVAEGLRYTLGDPVFRTITLSSAVWNFCVSGQYALTLVFLIDTLDVPPALVGVLFAAGGVGGILGAVSAERLTGRYGSGRTWRAALCAAPVVGLLLPAAMPGWGLAFFVVGSVGLTAGVALANVVSGSARQALCPPELIGRMSATSRAITWGVIPIGALVAGAIARSFDIRTALWGIGGAFFAGPVIIWCSPLRHVSDLQAPPPSPSREETAATSR